MRRLDMWPYKIEREDVWGKLRILARIEGATWIGRRIGLQTIPERFAIMIPAFRPGFSA